MSSVCAAGMNGSPIRARIKSPKLHPRRGTTNPELLRQKYAATVWFLLDALKRYAPMDVEQVRTIALEIATLGRSGWTTPVPIRNTHCNTIPDKSCRDSTY